MTTPDTKPTTVCGARIRHGRRKGRLCQAHATYRSAIHDTLRCGLHADRDAVQETTRVNVSDANIR